MRRIDGDEHVALQFAGALKALDRARVSLRNDCPVRAMEDVVTAVMVLNRALCDLEVITDVPWTAIPMDLDVCRADD